VRRSLLPDGTAKDPKTGAGRRTVPILPALRRELLVWKLKAPHKRSGDLIIGTADGKPVEERNLRRAFDAAKDAAKVDVGEPRLSWHALRHSAASMLATELELPATTLAAVIGHADAGFTLRVYARDGRDPAAVVRDVLERGRRRGDRPVTLGIHDPGGWARPSCWPVPRSVAMGRIHCRPRAALPWLELGLGWFD
jgi:integrase